MAVINLNLADIRFSLVLVLNFLMIDAIPSSLLKNKTRIGTYFIVPCVPLVSDMSGVQTATESEISLSWLPRLVTAA